MPDREKKVLTLYYYEGLTLAQIGEVLGVTESRVCQIHTKSVLQLRSRLAASRAASPPDLSGCGRPSQRSEQRSPARAIGPRARSVHHERLSVDP